MKTNTMMRLASVLLVAVLLSTCAIAGTYAKYVTTVEKSDTARVAAWGFNGTGTTIDFDLFNDTYNSGKVDSNDDANVIAPGASQTETVKLNYNNSTGKGAPEVAYTIDINVKTAQIGANIEANKNIVWSFNGTTYEHTTEKTSWDQMIEALEAYHEDVAANNLPTITNTGISIGWEWKFSTDENGDKADTALGDASTLESVTLKIEIVATQVGETPAQGDAGEAQQ